MIPIHNYFSIIIIIIINPFLDGGSKWGLQQKIDAHVLTKFNDARSNYGIVHESDLQRRALEMSNEVATEFVQSISFLILV